MPISEQTKLEMEAGALQLAKVLGKVELPPGYMEQVYATQMRHRQLKEWEKEGHITIEWVGRRDTKNERAAHHVMVHCGEHSFNDIPAEEAGAFPSEVLIANIALALAAGQGNKRPF